MIFKRTIIAKKFGIISEKEMGMLLIKNATIVNSSEEERVDLLIEGDRIVQIASEIRHNEAEVLDIEGNYLLPGIVDLNVRLKDNLFKMDHIDRLVQKAKKSGVTTLGLMPDFHPALESETLMELLQSKLEKMRLDIKVAVKGSKNSSEKEMNDVAIMLHKGASLLYEDSSTDSNILRRVMQYGKMKGVPLLCRCDNPQLNDSGVMNDGEIAAKLGLAGITKISEISEVAKVAQMANYYGVKTVFQTLSTKKSLDIIAQEGGECLSEVSILHLIFSDQACEGFHTLAKVFPPFREGNERVGLLQALQEAKIDLLTAMHSAKSYNSKDVAFNDATFGVDSLEYFLSLCYTYLVKAGYLSLGKLMEMIATTPAQKVLGLDNLGEVKEGYIANLVIFNPHTIETINNPQSLFHQMRLEGEVVGTIYQGQRI